MNPITRRLTAGIVTAAVGSLAAAAAVASPAAAGVIIHDGDGQSTSAADFPPGPSAAGSALIPCL